MTYIGMGYRSIVEVSGPGASTARRVYAGEIKWDWQNPAPAGFEDIFYAYCVDILQYLTPSQTVSIESASALTSASIALATDAGAKASWLVNTYASVVRAGGSNANIAAAALQVAIWEALYDSANNLTGGTFKLITTGAILTTAQGYLSALYSGPGGYQTANAILLDTGIGQDQITSVPEPGTLSLLGVGLLLAGRRLRKART